jgi:predicted membrane GTPase involved in stress response
MRMRMVPLTWLLPTSCSIEARGRLFIKPGQDIYEGQVIGIHQRAGDLAVNACKRKAATNIRRCSCLSHA